MKVLFALLCFLALTNQSRAMDDASMSKLLIGTWVCEGDQVVPDGKTHYTVETAINGNGEFDSTWSYVLPAATPGAAVAPPAVVRVQGEWEIRDSFMHVHVAQVTPSSYAPGFQDTSKQIHFLDKDSWQEEGSVRVYRRK